jgi:DNA-binding response OmpR family regulator
VPTVLIFSDDPAVREEVRLAVGRRPSQSLDAITWLDASTGAEVMTVADAGEADLLILDAEAQPEGGMGLARQVKAEVADSPPVLLLLARQADRWLARWSLAEGSVQRPLEPGSTVAEVVRLLQLSADRVPTPPRTGRFGLAVKARP